MIISAGTVRVRSGLGPVFALKKKTGLIKKKKKTDRDWTEKRPDRTVGPMVYKNFFSINNQYLLLYIIEKKKIYIYIY